MSKSELENKWKISFSKAIIDMVIKKITSLGIEPCQPALFANTLPTKLSLTM